MTKHFIHLFALTIIPVKAAIIISEASTVASAPIEIGSNIYNFDVNNDGQIDWSMTSRTQVFGSNGVSVLSESTTGFIYQTLTVGDFARIIPLAAGTLIGTSLEDSIYSWYHGFGQGLSSRANNQNFGSFYLKEGYLGFELQADDGTHYGYAYLESLGTSSIRISQVAWETEPGKAIQAGNVPEPSSSLLLAISICLTATRRKRV